MTCKCIGCGATWPKPAKNDGTTGSICNDCLTEAIRAVQRRKGYHDCFKRAIVPCSEKECKFWDICCAGL